MGQNELFQSFDEIDVKCRERMIEGQKKYGQYDPESEDRDFFEEMIEEMYDTINYAKMQIVKLKQLQHDYNIEHRFGVKVWRGNKNEPRN